MKLFDTEDWFIKLSNETDHCLSPGGMAGREDFDCVIIKFTPPERLCKVLMNPPHWQAIINSPLLIVSKERLIPLRSVWKLCVSHKILSLPPPLLFKLESNCTFNGLIPPDLKAIDTNPLYIHNLEGCLVFHIGVYPQSCRTSCLSYRCIITIV